MIRKILITDDHGVVRKGLKDTLLEFDDRFIIHEASSGEEAIAKHRENDYDIILLDLSLPGIKGLETLKIIKADSPRTQVLIVSMYPEEQYASRAIKSGASGYLTKDTASQELIMAITKIWQGGRYITPSVANHMANDWSGPRHKELADREYEVMLLIARGISPKEIGDQLKISPKTVNVMRDRIMEKLNLKTNAEITIYAVKANLIE